MLKWGVPELVREAANSFETVVTFERGRPMRPATEKKIVAAFATYGVEITSGDGTGARLLNTRPRR